MLKKNAIGSNRNAAQLLFSKRLSQRRISNAVETMNRDASSVLNYLADHTTSELYPLIEGLEEDAVCVLPERARPPHLQHGTHRSLVLCHHEAHFRTTDRFLVTKIMPAGRVTFLQEATTQRPLESKSAAAAQSSVHGS